MTIGSICAGIGGFDLGFQREGFQTKWHSEIDEKCRLLLRTKFPEAKDYGDITQWTPKREDRVDVVCGGTPCQDLSVAGRRKGLDGERSGLFYQMVRVCKTLRVRMFLWENVPGALSSNGGRDFAAVLRAWTGLKVEVPADGWGGSGFVRTPFPAVRWNVAWRSLDSQYFGLAQRRERLFLVGSLGDASCLQVLFEPDSLSGNPPPRREAGQGAAPAVEGRAGRSVELNTPGLVAKDLKAQGNLKHREDSETYVCFGGNNTSGPIDVSTACNAKGGVGRMDFDSETFVAQCVWQTPEGIRVLRHALSTLQEMGRSDDGEAQSTHSNEKGFGREQRTSVRRLTPT